MSDPDRLERALPDLLRRSGWNAPQAGDPPSLPPEELARWEGLLAEPPAPIRNENNLRRFPIGPIGATGLVAAALVLAVGLNAYLQHGSLTGLIPAPTNQTLSNPARPQAARPAAPKPPAVAQAPKSEPRPPSRAPATKTVPAPAPPVPSQAGRSEEAAPLREDRERSTAPRSDTSAGTAAESAAPAGGAAPGVPAMATRSALPVVRLINTTGLDAGAVASLNQVLDNTPLPAESQGAVAFEADIERGRVRQLRLVEENTTLKADAAIDALRRSLVSWTVPGEPTAHAQITLEVEQP
ncbi:after-VIT domain-containing protein [Gloeobacter kilaueensis]|uniref:Alpha-ketoglutarate decarboxylase n=1 Tax=Gloeobacter kilaueensis (strain ATCC BAA-2537 / CCAP 1431/1 / ULC 316 / JS1) TaxID=1183438 RepID=U5QPU4_GLOK1|nr:after-VIT domain-containing protein [Gloeobacter kilaueensis]AGY59649.1 alpha-ketoglutarate decarboxylase [Gloeobacter kilaueensis JS1]